MGHVRIALRVGSDLREEPHSSSDKALTSALRDGDGQGVDGGLDILFEGQRVSWSDLWDRVDGALLAWLEALDAITGGAAEAIAELPDTRVEILLTGLGDKRVRIEYEDVDATVDAGALSAAMAEAAGRLLRLADAAGVRPEALQRLSARAGHPPAGD